MSGKTTSGTRVREICRTFGNDPARMMDIAREVQKEFGCVGSEALDAIGEATGVARVEVQSLVSFYAFLSETPKGKVTIRVCNDVVDMMMGAENVAKAFCEELGLAMGATSADSRFTVEWTPCIGMSDQAPAALINDVVVTNLSPERARHMAKALKDGAAPATLLKKLGDGNNANPLVGAMVWNNIRRKGPVVFADFESGSALKKALAMTPQEVIRDVKTSRLRGRGGAGFPTGMKWDFTRQAEGTRRFVLCNADEGEPGTFKDRAILTEYPDLLLEGMTIAGYAIGAEEGILYLRSEYQYLRAFLEAAIEARRKAGLLGKNIAGKAGVNFEIRVQMGAGAYICGEETALISSCEGLRGDPKNRPPFPAQKGYLGCPTAVNNVETYCCAARILDKGPGWFAGMGSKGSPGTKVLSVCGDCKSAGIYEVPFGIPLKELLVMAGGEDAIAVQVGGPSGRMVGPSQYGRTICYDDLATGGSVIVLGPGRNVVDVARQFLEFFVEESCGYCTPCRVGCVLLKQKLDLILAGKGQPSDLDYMKEVAANMKTTSRCGLGQTAGNPVASTLEGFKADYDKLMSAKTDDVFLPAFSIREALQLGESLQGRKSEIFS